MLADEVALERLYSLQGRVALVTGGVGLLGRVHATALARAGARVVVADLPAVEPEKRAPELMNGDAVGVSCDICDEGQLRALMETIQGRFGRLDVVVNDAGIVGSPTARGVEFQGGVEDYPIASWEAVIRANLTAAFLVNREAGRLMRANGGGSIINVSSIYGIVGPDHRIYAGLPLSAFVSYSASKAGVLGLTRYLATYWAGDGIRVNAVVPGGVYNDHDPVFVERYANRTPMGRMADRKELAGIILFLASDASSYCTGQQFVVDGGLTAW